MLLEPERRAPFDPNFPKVSFLQGTNEETVKILALKTHSKAYILVPVYKKVYYSDCSKKEERTNGFNRISNKDLSQQENG